MQWINHFSLKPICLLFDTSKILLIMEEIQHPFYPSSPLQQADAVAWVFTTPSSTLQKYPFKFLPLEPSEVRLKILHTSLCQSDVHHSRGHWGEAPYPCCPGHEVVGQITMVGEQSNTLKVGDLVGVSPIRYSDNDCLYCTNKHKSTNLCINRIFLYGDHFGGYATHMQIDHNWAIKIPEALHNRLHEIPPILCAGVTTYAPLKRYAKAGGTCAIVGIGGLGHLAIQYANKLGMTVTAFTTKTTNLQSLHFLGAIDAQSSSDEKQLARNEGKYDLVVSTLYIEDSNLHRLYQRLTKPGGTFVIVGLPKITIPYHLDNEYIVNNQITVAGSIVGSIREVAQVLQFSAHYGIASLNEYYGFEEIGKAFDKVEQGNSRYRGVVNVTEWAKQNGFDK